MKIKSNPSSVTNPTNETSTVTELSMSVGPSRLNITISDDRNAVIMGNVENRSGLRPEFGIDFKEKVADWWNEIAKSQGLKFDIWLGYLTENNLILFYFSDASENGMASFIYAKVTNIDEEGTSLVISKSRVAPMKRLSIHRLEFTAALLCARLMAYVIKSLEVLVTT